MGASPRYDGEVRLAAPCRLFIFVLLCVTSAVPVYAHPPLEEAEARVDAAKAQRPDDPELHVRHALLHRRRGNWDAAIGAYRRAADLGADRDEIDSALAQVFLRAGEPRTARAHAEAVLARSPDLAVTVITRARIHRALGNDAEAADDFTRGISLLRRPEPALVVEAMQHLLTAGDPDGALAVADDAMGKLGVIVTLQLPAVEIELTRSRFERALARVETLLERSPRHVQWLALRGEVLEAAGRSAEAADVYRRVLALIAERPAERRADRIVALEQRLRLRLASEHEAGPRAEAAVGGGSS